MKKSLPFILIILGVITYSYYNYNSRSKCVDAISEYQATNDLVQIWHFKEMHFNIFDRILIDKQSYNFMFLDTSNLFFDDHRNYTAYVQKWVEPCDLETKYNLSFERRSDDFYIVGYDLMWLEQYRDTLSIDEIENTIFEVTNNWIEENY